MRVFYFHSSSKTHPSLPNNTLWTSETTLNLNISGQLSSFKNTNYHNGENVLDEDNLEDGEGANCASCHSKEASIDLETAYHRECMGCHRRVNKQEGDTLPITCQDCHSR